MALNESCVPLLSDDHLDIWDLGDIDCRKTTKWSTCSDTEGSSSGYDSSIDDSASESDCDLSESEFSEEESSDDETDSEIDEEKESDLDERSEVMTYSSVHALCKQLKYILSVPDLCDVTFEVGPNKVPVHGLKAIMGTRSRTLYGLILKAQREREELTTKKSKFAKKKKTIESKRLVIQVSKYEPEDFRKIIQFVHCGTVEVDINCVTGVLCGAVQFVLEDLEAACWDFISRGVNLKSLDTLIDSVQNYKQHKTANELILKVHENLKTLKCSTRRQTTV